MALNWRQVQSILAVVFACKYADLEDPMALVEAANEVLGDMKPSKEIIARADELGIGGWIQAKETVRA